MSKTAKKKAPPADDAGVDLPPVVPPPGFTRSGDLRVIDGVLHQRYVPGHPGDTTEHWQPVEEWETDKTGELTKSDPPA